MYENYIGKTLTSKELFDTFIDRWVVGGNRDNIPIEFVAKTFEEARAWSESHKYSKGLSGYIFRGKMSRKGTQVIENSNVTLDDLVGIWHGISVPYEYPGDSKTLILLPTGKAAISCIDSRVGMFCTKFDWYVEDNKITLESSTHLISFRRSFIYRGYRDSFQRLLIFEPEGHNKSDYRTIFDGFPEIYYMVNGCPDYTRRIDDCQRMYDDLEERSLYDC